VGGGDVDGKDDLGEAPEAHASYVDRMLEVLRKSPVLQVGADRRCFGATSKVDSQVRFSRLRLPPICRVSWGRGD
jgi:hypothetical protein